MSEAQMRRISYLRSIVTDRDAEIERLRAALREIDERHIPDQPSALDIPEEDYVRRQYTKLRRIARAALAGAEASDKTFNTGDENEERDY